MEMRWVMLGVLFLARMTMGFQFQAVPALTPELASLYGVSLSGIGLLIGLYLAPGVLVAIPGGAIAAWLGDRRVIGGAMAVMFLGGAVMMFAPGWEAALAGRVLAGTGGVIVNVVMTKMLVDWFAGREIATALAIFVNSWPVGIAAALLVLPPAAALGGLALADGITLALIGAALVLFLAVYRPAPGAPQGPAGIAVAAFPVVPLACAGLVWAFYNAALAMVFGFGVVALGALGWTTAAAAALISAFMGALAVSLPFGGLLADRTGRRDTVICASLAGFALLCPLALVVGQAWVPVILLLAGAVFGLAAGPVMSLPAQVLPQSARAFGMGVFFAIYYAVMLGAPALGGGVADASGDRTVVFVLAAGLSVAALAALGAFRVAAPGAVQP
ncbi:MAG: MFS transporter [Pseudomonadota bacterium]